MYRIKLVSSREADCRQIAIDVLSYFNNNTHTTEIETNPVKPLLITAINLRLNNLLLLGSEGRIVEQERETLQLIKSMIFETNKHY